MAYRTDLHESNIQFSKRAFDFIKGLESCYVMIGDFTHFFDNLDHNYLKKQWKSLLGCEQLPADHYSIFRSVTKYSSWELTDLLNLNGLEDTKEGRKDLNSKVRVISREQYKQNRSQIKKNVNPYGIPQGSPISAVLANVYMLEVDKTINDVVKSLGGLYMRYSDDFIIVLPLSTNFAIKEEFEKICNIIRYAPRLELEPSKTQYFSYSKGILVNCGSEFNAGADCSNKVINFLGFSFNGQKISIRPKTVSKYYYRMYRKATNIADAGWYTPTGKHISCENLYNRYSERGAYKKPGNFITYVVRAEKEFGSDEEIAKDTKRHMQKIRKALKGKR